MSWTPPNKRALPLDEWPHADRIAWESAQEPRYELIEVSPAASRWRPTSKQLFVRIYGLWLAWLKSQGLLIETETPSARANKSRVLAYLQDLRAKGCKPRTLMIHMMGLRHMFLALAPEGDWGWTLTAIQRLNAVSTPVKSHTGLPSSRELFELGWRVMRKADQSRRLTPREQALAFRNGLAIAMLAARPLMRRANLASIDIGKNLIEEGAVFRLHFTGDEMKGRQSRGGPLPQALTGPIRLYLEVYRPRLLAVRNSASERFFISGMGRPIYAKSLATEVVALTEMAFGRRINLHEFRHAAGSSIANESPDHVGIVPSILGHTEFRTSERYYVFADEQSAFRALNEAIKQLEK
ncbi:site-specific integrase [Alsobacter sp. SYSU M60028]|uniref:Site-specific integrase n=1 Tax=Alsobacter ponti TaxID=2962936 RepID=A0ABT1LEL0_9HYPH|nr:site-specific integrase [Alsobacter ponti]MCP8939929.1 site-specific integrase [Alsobacter ponti]